MNRWWKNWSAVVQCSIELMCFIRRIYEIFISMCIYRNRIEEIKWNPNTNSVRFKHLEHLCDAGIKMNLIQNQIRFYWNPSSILRWCNVRYFFLFIIPFCDGVWQEFNLYWYTFQWSFMDLWVEYISLTLLNCMQTWYMSISFRRTHSHTHAHTHTITNICPHLFMTARTLTEAMNLLPSPNG